MARTQNPNLDILILAVDQLGTLTDDMVFLGGCATGLLITDPRFRIQPGPVACRCNEFANRYV